MLHKYINFSSSYIKVAEVDPVCEVAEPVDACFLNRAIPKRLKLVVRQAEHVSRTEETEIEVSDIVSECLQI